MQTLFLVLENKLCIHTTNRGPLSAREKIEQEGKVSINQFLYSPFWAERKENKKPFARIIIDGHSGKKIK